MSLSALTVVCALAICLSGCRYPVKALHAVDNALTDLVYAGEGQEFAHPGETEAEVRRRHDRVQRLNEQAALADLDRALMLDRPSRLNDKRLP